MHTNQSSGDRLEEGSNLYGNKACNEEDLLCECEQICLKPYRKAIPREKTFHFRYFLKTILEKKIENSFSMITDLLPRHIHATSAEGFLLKILLFVLAFTIL